MKTKTKRTNVRRLDKTEVSVALAQRGWKQRHLAEAVGRSVPVVNQAINHGENAGTVVLIAEVLCLELKEVAL